MASQAKHNRTATIISGIFFLIVACALFYATFSLRSAAQGRELKISLAELYTSSVTYGDYLTISDTGAVVTAASDITDEMGNPLGRAFILNGISNYVFLAGTGEQFTDTTGKEAIALQPGQLIPVTFQARIDNEGAVKPIGAEQFAIQNGMSTGQPFYLVETGVTKGDNSIPFYLTMLFGILALVFSAGSWWSLLKKKR